MKRIVSLTLPPCCPETSERLMIYYDMRDIALVAKACGSYPGHPKWNKAADVYEDGEIDIRDIAIITKQKEQTKQLRPRCLLYVLR